ncbi:MAG TPA: tripartite tricarboxylate transporter substrate binding protein [Burkholderiales bacterium]|nr:tripartite tricarboxylate transporter substrate binding protein [Burkholderiales bacterium]
MKLGVVIIAGAMLGTFTAHAQTFGAKPIRLVVGFPPGGPADLTARLLADKLPALLGASVIVDNRVGANATIGADYVAKSGPDGHTLFVTTCGAMAISPHIGPKLPYDPLRDFVPISQAANAYSTIAVHPSLPVRNAKEFVALARARKGQITMASTGIGSIPHLAQELLKASAGIELVHVPYKGAAPSVADAIGGQVSSLILDVTPLLPHLRAGRLRAIGIAGDKRVTALPDVPTMEEQGFKNVEAPNWYAVFAPAKTPRETVERLNDAVRKAIAMTDVRERLTATGADPVSSTPQQLAELLQRDYAKWGKVIRDNNITE